ncbi:putative MFS family arabinose efflux permease [Ilumatobacter fluminis]|uniref:Putative MFS family arabinose efflux permease n=1 Tax=Ilumatobacter fluminis TaxID=467091 RepID=A0A4R7HXG6_9ACTN|nr:MFS transporter [Ilumatobacter fluminis]TDT15745.1 putative MFS family arabinose efflux permease [Ilumatobacter fluminis]
MTDLDTRPSARPVVAVSVSAAVASALPGFLVGALAVQMRSEFDVGESVYAWAMSGYFLAASFASIPLGRVAQRVGPRRQIVAALSIAAAANVAIAATARSFGLLVAVMALIGVCNAAAQTAVNLALASARLERLGFAISIKQSGMPLASMLSGLAVPVIALTVGWRWAFVTVAAIGFGTAAAVMRVLGPYEAPDRETDDHHRRSGSPSTALLGAAVASGFLSFGAGALNAWVVESGVDAGLGEGVAGLMLAGGAALGVAIRLVCGVRLDRSPSLPFRRAGVIALVGATGVALLAVRSAPVHVIATLVGFAGGWIWPVFTNFGIVRTNAGRAAAATGITQTGVYVGVFVGPLASGVLIERAGYGPMWIVTAVAMAVGAVVAIRVARHF